MKRIILLIFLLNNTYLFAQSNTGKILYYSNAKQIELKWYSSNRIMYPEGCNIYRTEQSSGTWELLEHVKKQPNIAQQVLENDTTLDLFVHMANELPADFEYNFAILNLLIKSFQSNEYAKFLGIYFKDNSVAPGKSYKYRVTHFRFGREITLAETPFITTEKSNFRPPEKFEVDLKNNIALINWLQDDDRFYGVNIYRRKNNDAAYVMLNTYPVMAGLGLDSAGNDKNPEALYRDQQLEENSTYYYKIAGVGYFGEESILSEPAEIFVKDQSPPPAPANLKRDFKQGVIYLTWENPAPDTYHQINIYKSEKSDGPYEKLNNSELPKNTTSFQDTGMEGMGYYYYVASKDTSGNENRSNRVFVDVPDLTPPKAPTGVTIAADTGVMVLKWHPNTEKDLLGYYLYRNTAHEQEGEFMLLQATAIRDTVYMDLLPKNAKNRFIYRLVALDTSYNHSDPSKTVSAVMPDITPPDAPFLKNITPEDLAISIEWNPSLDGDLMGYHVYRSIGEDAAEFKILQEMLSKTTGKYTDRQPVVNILNNYRIVAVDSAGNVSESSNIMSARIIGKSNGIEEDQIVVKYDQEDKKVILNWKLPEDNEVKGVVVFKKVNENDISKPISGMLTVGYLEDKALKGQAKVSYEFRTYFKNGNIVRSKTFNIDLNHE